MLCNRILKGYSILPPSLFTPHPFPHLRHNHSLPLYHPTCRSTAHLSSFSVSVVPLWNRLPMDIVCAPSLYSFKKRLNFFNLTLSVLALYSSFVSVLSLFVLGSLYISLTARWLHPCMHFWCCTKLVKKK